MKILSLGEIIWDIYESEKCIGGAPLNFAAHAALLGADSFLLSAVGGDSLAEPATEALKAFGVKTDYVTTVAEKPTGKCLVSLDKKGVPSYALTEDVAYDYLSSDASFEGFDAFSFGTLIQRSEGNRALIKQILANNKFPHIFCDLNLRKPFYDKESALLCAENATILKISREELPAATALLLDREISAPATAARALANTFKNLKLIIITLDCDGAFAFSAEERASYFCPAKKVPVVSTVGAGDSFGAAFLTSFLSEKDANLALENAVAKSAFVVSKREAVPM